MFNVQYELFFEFTNAIDEIAISNLFGNVIIDRINQLHETQICTKHNFCDVDLHYSMSIGSEEYNKVIKVDIFVEKYYNVFSLLKAIFNIPSYGLRPFFSISKKTLGSEVETIMEIALEYPELFSCKSLQEFFEEFDKIQKGK